MAEELKAQAVEAEEPKSIAEQEKEVLQNAGVTVEEDGMYKVNVDEVNKSKENQNAIQEQETKDGVLRGSSENEKAGEVAEVELQGVREEEKIEESPIIEEITDETNCRGQADGEPQAVLGAAAQQLVERPGRGVEANALVTFALGDLLDPHEDPGPDALRAAVTAPHPAGDHGDKTQAEGGNHQNR